MAEFYNTHPAPVNTAFGGLRGGRNAPDPSTTYWTSRGTLSQQAQHLATLRQATVLTISGADEFFKDLLDRVLALEDIGHPDILSAQVAVKRMKRYLPDTTQGISLHDLLTSETEKTRTLLTGARFPMSPLFSKDMPGRVKAYEVTLETISHLLICGAYWGEAHHDDLLLSCYKRIAEQDIILAPATANLARYPGLYLLYGMGIAACAAKNYRFLRLLFSLKLRYIANGSESAVAAVIDDESVMDKYSQAQVLEGKYMCDHLFNVLRDPLRGYVPSDYGFSQTFDWFEYLLCLCHCDASVTRPGLADMKARDPDFVLPASFGRFGHRLASWNSIRKETEVRKGERLPEKVADILQAGFFESGGRQQSDDKYRDVKAAFDRFVLKGGPSPY
ncbi:MAG: hypothetical protein ACLQU1_03940 [Bryobacteraceae bacterium]